MASDTATFALFRQNHDPQRRRVCIGTCQCAPNSAIYATLDQLPGDIVIVCDQERRHRWLATDIKLHNDLAAYKLKKELREALDSWVDLNAFLPRSEPFGVESVNMPPIADADDEEEGRELVGTDANATALVRSDHTIVVGNGHRSDEGDIQWVHGITHTAKNILYHYGPWVVSDAIVLFLAIRAKEPTRIHRVLANLLPKYFPEYLRQSAANTAIELLSDVVSNNASFIRGIDRIQQRWQLKWTYVPEPTATLSLPQFTPAAEDTSRQIARVHDLRSGRKTGD